ncbi:MAG: hypothetical protein AAFY88_03730 [Acidobacteriota bacterium]
MLDGTNARAKAARLRRLHDLERRHHDALNVRLAAYSQAPTPRGLNAVNTDAKALRDRLNAIHNEMAGLTAEYAASTNRGHRRLFMENFVGRAAYSHGLEARFKDFADRTELDATDRHAADIHKNRFLAHSLQNLRFATGRGRFNELMTAIDVGRTRRDPKRKIKISTRTVGAPKAGLAAVSDLPYGHKTDVRNAGADAALLRGRGGNLREFVEQKRLAGDRRVANPNRRRIGDLQVLMDRGAMVGPRGNQTFESPLLPVYYGHNQRQEVEAYTAPIHTAFHHEIGHLTNSLKGIEGPAHDRYRGGLGPMTNEEELYNIHLDRHSDEVLSNEMRLPTRIAHTSFGGLDAGTADLRHDLMSQDLANWDDRTHRVRHKRALLAAIKSSVDSDQWGQYTKGWRSRPQTVRSVRGRLGRIPRAGGDMGATLAAIRRDAVAAHIAGNSNRNAATAAFYNVLRTMDLNSRAGLRAATAAVSVHRATHL